MAHTMLRHFPRVAAHEQTADVVQEASLSLLTALRQLDLADTRSFFNLASEHIRRRLLDMARKHRRRSLPPAPDDPDADLEWWSDLHEAAENLATPLREAFSLHFYHGWTFAEMAKVLGVSLSTARRHWFEAVAVLAGQLGDLPK